MKNSIKKFAIDMRIRIGYGAAVFLLLVSYIITLYANAELLKQIIIVNHTNKVILHLESLISTLKDAETGYRGFIIIKNKKFLAPYEKSLPKIDSIFNLLQNEMADTHSQQEKLRILYQLFNKRLGAISYGIDHYTKNNFELNDSLRIKSYFGNQVMDQARTLVNEMQSAERTLLKIRTDQLDAGYKTLNIIVIISLFIALLLGAYGFFTYLNENKARRIADEKVFQYQDQLKERINELDSANKELIRMRNIEKLAATGRIARTIAHEVRNPLTNINLAVDQLKTEMDHSNETASQMLDVINRNSNRINQLITDLLNSTKFSELVHQKVSINLVLDETLELAKDRLQLNNMKVHKDFTKDICDISVDVERIKIAFLNIIVNAIEAMEPEKGILYLKTESKNGKCVITISDNGIGMDKESLSKLFEPYFTSKPKGTGLGLTNTQSIILNHKGLISVESEPGKGTTFIISLDFA